MRIPDFTAEATLYRTAGHYRSTRRTMAPGRLVVPQDDETGVCDWECDTMPELCPACYGSPSARWSYTCQTCLAKCHRDCSSYSPRSR
ncbi:hypothetical protein GCM10009760_35260 [Kitasatospora kazusensis]|uniref:Uncharacterized protein n=1 Tax=Kitasatospora kazusensis TaxID=407974 RepID=A0ABN2ZQL8_9ACTN